MHDMSSSSSRQLVLGLTGRNGAGKGAVAQVLRERYGFKYMSLSDTIRAHLKEQGIAESREALISAGNEMRRSGGPGTLGERAIAYMQREAGPCVHWVVDSIRSPAEVAALRAHPSFRLIDIRAGERQRFERLIARGRMGDAQTFAEFREHEMRELESADASAQQLLATAALADLVVNNEAGLEQLQAETDAVVRPLLDACEKGLGEDKGPS